MFKRIKNYYSPAPFLAWLVIVKIKNNLEKYHRLPCSFLLLLLPFTFSLEGVNLLRGISFFSQRSQSTDAAREIVGWHPFINKYGATQNYVTTAVTPVFNQSVRPLRMAQALFGTNILTISGSLVEARGEDDMLADYFGLSQEFQSTVELNPLVRNALVDLQLYIGFDSWVSGLFFYAHMPAGWTQWNLNLKEKVFNRGNNTPFPAGYMAPEQLISPFNSFIDAIKGETDFGSIQGLSAGKINGPQAKSGVSDIQLSLGWNFILTDTSHAGLSIRTAIPTGSRPTSEFLFEPILGNGKHWELGIGFTGHVLIWEKDADQELSFFCNIHLMHLFKARQRRSFDLCRNGFGSRYILTKLFNNAESTNMGAPLINYTTLSCDVSVDIQADGVLMFGYTYRNVLFDIGYNGWIRSKEKITRNQQLTDNRFGLKGIQNIVGNVTQSTATLLGNNFTDQAAVADPNSPVFIKDEEINNRSARSPLVLTHKLFTHLSYAWENNKTGQTIPFLGIGGEIEFEGINTHNSVEPQDKTTMSQWGIWVKFGFAY
ncbi:MAG: hypothetical protein WCD44_03095 [Candidatus Babeliales bacterium]